MCMSVSFYDNLKISNVIRKFVGLTDIAQGQVD